MEEYLDNLLLILETLGYPNIHRKALIPTREQSVQEPKTLQDFVFHIQMRNVKATMQVAEAHYVVRAGSRISKDTRPWFEAYKSAYALRERLIEQKKLILAPDG